MPALRDSLLSLDWLRARGLLAAAPPSSGELRSLLAPKNFYRLMVSELPGSVSEAPPFPEASAARAFCLRSLWLAAPSALAPSELGLARSGGFAALAWLWSLGWGSRVPWAADPSDPSALLATQRAILAVDPLAPAKALPSAPVTAAFSLRLDPYQGLTESFVRPGPSGESPFLALESLGGPEALPEGVWERCLLRSIDGPGGLLPKALSLRPPSERAAAALWSAWRARAVRSFGRLHPDDLLAASVPLLRDGSAIAAFAHPESFLETQRREFALEISAALLSRRSAPTPTLAPATPSAFPARLAASIPPLADFLSDHGFAPLIPWDALRKRAPADAVSELFAAIERGSLAAAAAPAAPRRKSSL